MSRGEAPLILCINPGSTSVKLGLFRGKEPLREANIPRHDPGAQNPDKDLALVRDFVATAHPGLVMARGGLLKPMPSGVYRINERMLRDLENAAYRHASNLAAPMAYRLAVEWGVPAYIADPVTTDELHEIARPAGHPLFERKSIFHALNHKATARKYAESVGRRYEDMNLIVIHLGGGISIGAHQRGRVVDVNQALDGEGPFTPQRSGTLPAGDLVRMAFSGRYSMEEMLRMITGQGGLKAYTGTSDMRALEKRLKNEPEVRQAVDAMIYQTAKYAGEMAVVLRGDVDAIIITGGLAYSGYIVENLLPWLQWMAPVAIFPGENELAALAYNGWLVWTGRLAAREY